MKNIFFILLGTILFTNTSHADWHFGLMLGYSPLYTADLTGGASNGNIIAYDLKYEGSSEAGIDIWNLNKHSWGFISGVQLSQERKFKSGTLNGVTIDPNSPSPTFQTNFAYLGTAYKWESFYFPLALTYGMSKVNMPPGYPTNEVKNGIGALLGFGYFFSDSFAIEYIGRSAIIDWNFSNGTTNANTHGVVGSALLNLKYFF